MKLDLDEIERKARAAVGGEWKVNQPATIVCDGNDDDIADASGQGWSQQQERNNAEHIAANSPPVTLALIARIRELEGALREGCEMVNSCIAIGSWSGIGIEFERLKSLLEKGAVPVP